MAKENPALQGDYFSEPINDTYYTAYIVFADYDTGEIKGRWGKGQYLGHSMAASGYSRESGTTSHITLDFVFEKCALVATDYTYSRLSGTITEVNTGNVKDIVFNKSKNNFTNG